MILRQGFADARLKRLVAQTFLSFLLADASLVGDQSSPFLLYVLDGVPWLQKSR